MDTTRARASLSQALHYLRRTVGEGTIVTRGTEEIGVDLEKVSCDALAFQDHLQHGRLEEAATLYGGEFLHAYHLSNLHEFGEWVDKQRDRFRRDAMTASWKLADRARAEGKDAEAVRYGMRAHDLDIYGDESLRRLMSLLDATGHRTDAVRVYKEFAARLQRDLDAEPAPESKEVLSRILSRVDADPNFTHAPANAITAPPASRANDALPPHRQWNRRSSYMISATLISAIIAAVMLFKYERRVPPDSRRVFVATFVNRTGDAKFDAAGLLAADWIIEALQRTSAVEVVDPATAFAYGHDLPNAPLIPRESPLVTAKQMEAGTVVLGSFYLVNDSISFHAQIVDAARGTVRATVSGSTGTRADPLKSLDDFRQRVTGALASVVDERIATLSTPSSPQPTLASYEEYIAGLGPFIHKDFQESLPHFRRAVELDSSFALPRIWMEFALEWMGRTREQDSVIAVLVKMRDRLSPMDQYGVDVIVGRRRNDPVSELLASGRKAADLGPQSNWQSMLSDELLTANRPHEAITRLENLDPERGWVRGWTSYWFTLSAAYHMAGDYDGELRVATKAGKSGTPPLELQQGPADALMKTRAFAALGRTVEAMKGAQTFLKEPVNADDDPDLARYVARELVYHGYPQAADSLEREALQWLMEQRLRPAFKPWPTYQRSIARLQIDLGHYNEGIATLRKLVVSTPDSAVLLADLSSAFARKGDFASALTAVDHIEKLKSTDLLPATPTYLRAEIAALSGDKMRALSFLKQAFDAGYPIGPRIHRDIEFRSLWNTLEYRRLIEPKG